MSNIQILAKEKEKSITDPASLSLLFPHISNTQIHEYIKYNMSTVIQTKDDFSSYPTNQIQLKIQNMKSFPPELKDTASHINKSKNVNDGVFLARAQKQ